MERFDRLPCELRVWLSHAALPWSPHSVLRIWNRLMHETKGDVATVLARLDGAERKMLAKDCPRIWGESYPLEHACKLSVAEIRRIAAPRMAA